MERQSAGGDQTPSETRRRFAQRCSRRSARGALVVSGRTPKRQRPKRHQRRDGASRTDSRGASLAAHRSRRTRDPGGTPRGQERQERQEENNPDRALRARSPEQNARRSFSLAFLASFSGLALALEHAAREAPTVSAGALAFGDLAFVRQVTTAPRESVGERARRASSTGQPFRNTTVTPSPPSFCSPARNRSTAL
jgi:hypothetical protein